MKLLLLFYISIISIFVVLVNGNEEYLGCDVQFNDNFGYTPCLKKAGYTFITPEILNVDGTINIAMKQVIEDGLEVFNSQMDVQAAVGYLADKPPNQVAEEILVFLLNEVGMTDFYSLWLRVENLPGHKWSRSTQDNVNWLSGLMQTFETILYMNPVGIRTNEAAWNTIMGNSTAFSGTGINLYWVNHDNSTSMKDFKSFGGWNENYIKVKQYSQYTKVCGANIYKDVAISQR